MREEIKEIFLTRRHCFTDYERHVSYHKGRSLLHTHLEVWETSPQSLDTGSVITSLGIKGKDLDVCCTKNWMVS